MHVQFAVWLVLFLTSVIEMYVCAMYVCNPLPPPSPYATFQRVTRQTDRQSGRETDRVSERERERKTDEFNDSTLFITVHPFNVLVFVLLTVVTRLFVHTLSVERKKKKTLY